MTSSDPRPVPAAGDEPGAGAADRDAIDVGRLAQLRGLAVGDDEDVYVMLADLLLAELPKGIATMRTAADRQDAAAVASEAHRLSGAAGNIGATALAALLLELDDLGQSGRVPGGEALARVDAEHRRYRDAVAALRRAAAGQ